MGRFIFKIKDKNGVDYYGEWSTIVDAPVTWLLELEDFIKYYRNRYGYEGLKDLPGRLKRIDANGCSGHGYTLQDLFDYNRAGKNGRHIKTSTGLLRAYKWKAQ